MDSGFDHSPFRTSGSDVLTPPPTGVLCGKCKNQAYPGASFCRHCGATLPAKKPRAALKRQRVSAPKRKGRPTPERKASRFGAMVLLIIASLLIGAGGMYWWFTR